MEYFFQYLDAFLFILRLTSITIMLMVKVFQFLKKKKRKKLKFSNFFRRSLKIKNYFCHSGCWCCSWHFFDHWNYIGKYLFYKWFKLFYLTLSFVANSFLDKILYCCIGDWPTDICSRIILCIIFDYEWRFI